MTEMTGQPLYPARLEVDYPERQSRWKALLRLPLFIPIFIFYYLLAYSAQAGVTLAIWAAILVRGRIPHWLFDFQVALNRWQLRASAYLLLLTDGYPPFEGDYAIRYEVSYPERSSRWRLVIWKFVTAVPHLFILAVLNLTLVLVVPIGWFAILIVGRFPQGLHWYVAGVLRWGARVNAYILSLTDEFPPFSFSPDAGPSGTDSYAISSVIGVLATGGIIAGIIALVIFAGGGEIVTEVSYERLAAGEVRSGETRVFTELVSVEISVAADPADELVPFLVAQPGYRFVLVSLAIRNLGGDDLRIWDSNFRLEDTDGDGHAVFLAVVGGRIPPLSLQSGGFASTDLIFELPRGVDLAEFRYRPARFGADTIVYQFR